jgi:hypothetical protein
MVGHRVVKKSVVHMAASEVYVPELWTILVPNFRNILTDLSSLRLGDFVPLDSIYGLVFDLRFISIARMKQTCSTDKAYEEHDGRAQARMNYRLTGWITVPQRAGRAKIGHGCSEK